MSDGTNVTPIRPGSGHPDHPGHREGDDWPSAADAVGREPTDDVGQAAVLDPQIEQTISAPEFLAQQERARAEQGAIREDVADTWVEDVPEEHAYQVAAGPGQNGVNQALGALESALARPKARTLSRAEREAQDAEAERIRIETERELAAVRKRFNEIDPLRVAPFIVALVLGVVIFLTSGLFSYAAIAAAAEWMRPEWAWLTLLVPGFVEAFMVYFGIDGIVYQARAHFAKLAAQRRYYQKQARSALVWMLVFAFVAVVGNGAHTLFRWLEDGDQIPWFGFVGIVMAALAPLSVVLITKRVSRLVFVYPSEEE